MNMDSYEDIMCQDKIQYYSCSAFQACYRAPYTVGRILSFLFLKQLNEKLQDSPRFEVFSP
jgi:hypothetical protein